METTACPSALLDADEGDALSTVDWWLGSTFFGDYGAPSGPPEWPLKGGLLRQPAKLVEAVEVLRSEWPHLREAHAKKPPAPPKR